MSLNDPLANCLSHILNSEKQGKNECLVGPKSKILVSVLTLLKDSNYIGDFSVVDESRGGWIKINLIGNINKCGVVKPRFSFTKDNYETFEKRYLPSKNFGLFIVTTSKGIMTHKEALDKGIGGKLIAYCY
ncbi:30S ribosomal protein S8 [Candidatus Woesearchaeota archaeon]|nr:30S ribosomal protein S8 [Candidatus Woesearchaeota archaeon]